MRNEVLPTNPSIRRVLAMDEIRLAEGDEDWLPDLIQDECEVVFTLAWDSSMPGTCGAIWINKWREIYFIDSSDFDRQGPFDTLDQALTTDILTGFSEGYSLWSKVIPLRELITLVESSYMSGIGGTIQINDEIYELTDTGFVRQSNA